MNLIKLLRIFSEIYMKKQFKEKKRKREKEIKDMGYNLVIMWEYDWNK